MSLFSRQFFLTYLNRWIWQGIKFPDKRVLSFPSSCRFFLLILKSWTANFPTKKSSDKILNVVFLPTIFFWTDIHFPTRDQICRQKLTPFSFFRPFLCTTKHHNLSSDKHDSFLIVHFVLWKCSRSQSFRGLRPLDPTSPGPLHYPYIQQNVIWDSGSFSETESCIKIEVCQSSFIALKMSKFSKLLRLRPLDPTPPGPLHYPYIPQDVFNRTLDPSVKLNFA